MQDGGDVVPGKGLAVGGPETGGVHLLGGEPSPVTGLSVEAFEFLQNLGLEFAIALPALAFALGLAFTVTGFRVIVSWAY